jgi:hypothetical protein
MGFWPWDGLFIIRIYFFGHQYVRWRGMCFGSCWNIYPQGWYIYSVSRDWVGPLHRIEASSNLDITIIGVHLVVLPHFGVKFNGILVRTTIWQPKQYLVLDIGGDLWSAWCEVASKQLHYVWYTVFFEVSNYL